MKLLTLILLWGLLLATVSSLLVTGCAQPALSPKGSTETPPSTKETGLLLTVSQPQDNTVTNTDRIEVKGHTNPGAVVSVQDEIVTADSEGNFSITITLQEDANIIEVVASDEAGHETMITLVVTLVKGG